MTYRQKNPIRRLATLAALAVLLGTAAARAASPDFDAVTWIPLTCNTANLISHTSPGAVDFVGDASNPPSYIAYDATYLYFRYRMDKNPAGSGGFAQDSWTALMQVPSGNPFQYQYELALNGNLDTIEIWQNSVAQDVSFSPLFHDTPEVQVFSQTYNLANGSTVNTTPLARIVVADTTFNGNADYFVDFAFPVAALVANGVIGNASDIANSLFFPATSTTSSNYNKGYLNCPFLPNTELTVTKTVSPTIIPANHPTPVDFTITVANTGGFIGKGIDVTDIALPAFLSNASVSVSASVGVTWQVMAANPMHVMVGSLPAGASLTIDLTATANATCADVPFDNVASAFGTNAMTATGEALLSIHHLDGFELCDGQDNDCDGVVDNGGDALCDDGNACNGAEVCAGAAGCQAGTPPNCDDGNACTTDSCDPTAGCQHAAVVDGTACDDGSACTQGDSCQAGSCTGAPVVCTAADQCHAAGVCDPQTGLCSNPAVTDGTACTDGNACTTGDACQAGSCVPGAPVVCTASDQCHTAGTCDPQSGQCSNPTAADGTACDDGSACTQSDSCQAGVCTGGNPVVCTALDQCHAAGTCDPGTGVCSNPTAADGSACEDGNPCTGGDVCRSGVCTSGTVDACPACTHDMDCNDHDDCTIDRCVAGSCTHSPDAKCQQTPQEICGNCIDDDGNGLVDAEDPACCPNPLPLDLRRLVLKPKSGKVRISRLRLKARYSHGMPAGFDPMSEDTSIQISDASGEVFCQTVTSPHWQHPRTPVFRFKDKKGVFAGGLRRGKFRTKKSGDVMFRTLGKSVDFRSTEGHDMLVTVRVGGQCAQARMSLRPNHSRLVYP